MKNRITILILALSFFSILSCKKTTLIKIKTEPNFTRIETKGWGLNKFNTITTTSNNELVLSGYNGYARLDSNMQIIKEKYIEKTPGSINTNFNKFNSLLYFNALNDSTERLTLLDIYSLNNQSFTFKEVDLDSDIVNWFNNSGYISNCGLVDLGTVTNQNIISFGYGDTTLMAYFEKDQLQNIKFIKLKKLYSPFYSINWEQQKYFKLTNGFLSIYLNNKDEIQRALIYDENGSIVDSLYKVSSCKRDGAKINLIQNNKTLYTINESTLKFEVKNTFDNIIDICEYDKDTVLILNKLGLFKSSRTSNLKYQQLETKGIDVEINETWKVTTFNNNILLYSTNYTYVNGQLFYRPKN